MNQKFTPDKIDRLNPNEIFVFGSNLIGQHMGGAARIARELFGAIEGQGVGLQGQSYAIPTMQGGVETIKPYVNEFIKFAKNHPELTFYVTRIGCGIAGFKDEQIAPLFYDAYDLENVILPEKFWYIINHAQRLASETEGMVFHSIPIKFSDEDIAKMENMSHDEKIDYVCSLKQSGKYTIVHDSPVVEYDEFILNADKFGHHKIAISENAYAIVADTKLYSDRYSWGMDFGNEIISIVAKDNASMDYPYGQFVVLLKDGSIKELWSEVCIKSISTENEFCGLASGCNGLVFGLRKDGMVTVFNAENNHDVAVEVSQWSDIVQIDAGPRHVVGLKRDKTVVAAGKPSACEPLCRWQNIERIFVAKANSLYYKENDLTFGIDLSGRLHVDGDIWSEESEFWKQIRAQYYVTDVVEDGYCLWVRTSDGITRTITYYSPMNYQEEINFVKKYPDFRYYYSYGKFKVLVDKQGEFRVLLQDKEVNWWDLQQAKEDIV